MICLINSDRVYLKRIVSPLNDLKPRNKWQKSFRTSAIEFSNIAVFAFTKSDSESSRLIIKMPSAFASSTFSPQQSFNLVIYHVYPSSVCGTNDLGATFYQELLGIVGGEFDIGKVQGVAAPQFSNQNLLTTFRVFQQ